MREPPLRLTMLVLAAAIALVASSLAQAHGDPAATLIVAQGASR